MATPPSSLSATHYFAPTASFRQCRGRCHHRAPKKTPAFQNESDNMKLPLIAWRRATAPLWRRRHQPLSKRRALKCRRSPTRRLSFCRSDNAATIIALNDAWLGDAGDMAAVARRSRAISLCFMIEAINTVRAIIRDDKCRAARRS